jgi:hypothetical protein
VRIGISSVGVNCDQHRVCVDTKTAMNYWLHAQGELVNPRIVEAK